MVDNPAVLSEITLTLDITIRPAEMEDIPRLEWFGRHWQFLKSFDHSYAEQVAGRRMILVADLNNFPVGRIIIQLAQSNPRYADGRTLGYLFSLAVLEPLRRQGIGTQLVLAAEDVLRKKGYNTATIAVAKDNERALRLYERLDYKRFGEDPGRWSFVDPAGERHRVNEPCWLLKKSLSS